MDSLGSRRARRSRPTTARRHHSPDQRVCRTKLSHYPTGSNVDNPGPFCSAAAVNFPVKLWQRFGIPGLAGMALLSLSACATPSNRRALYFPQDGLGPWHQFAHRQAVADDLGVPVASLPRPAVTVTTSTTVVIKPGAGPAPATPLVTPTVPATGSLDATGGSALPAPRR